jgi:GGDEF domain-containing protein
MLEITHTARQTSRGGRRFVQAVLAIRGLTGRGTNATTHHHVLTEVVAPVQTELKAFDHIGPQGRANGGADNGLDRHTCGFALQDGSGEAYNEEAFQYFLEIERKRAEISNRPFLLMLIDVNRHHGINPEIDVVTAGKLFSILSQCLRETDFIGWYRDGRIAGAVLTQHGEPDRDDLSDVVRRRVCEALEKHFPPDRPRGLQVRVYHLSPHTTLRSESWHTYSDGRNI